MAEPAVPLTPGPWTPDGIPDVVLFTGPAQRYQDNIHDELKLVLAPATGFTVTRRGTSYRAAPGQLIVLHAAEAHSGRPDRRDPGAWLITCLSPRSVAAATGSADLRFADPALPDLGLARRYAEVYRLLESPATALAGETALLDLLAAIGRAADPGPDTRAAGRPDGEAEARLVHMVRDYLGDNLSRNVSLGELAAVTGLDKYRLVRACTQWFGIPPHALHLRLRLDRARQLLRQGRSPAEVGYETGFYDQAHFTRTFTRSCGITPARYGAAFAVADGSSGDGRAGGTVTAGRKITRDLLGRP